MHKNGNIHRLRKLVPLSAFAVAVAVVVATAFYVILAFTCKPHDGGQRNANVYDVFSGHGNLLNIATRSR